MKRIFTMLSLAFIVAFGMSSCKNIRPGYEGVQVNCLGSHKGIVEEVLPVGVKCYMPGFTKVYKFPQFAKTVELKTFDLTAQDGSTISVTPIITLRIVPGTSPSIYTKYRENDIERLARTIIYNKAQNIYRVAFNEYPTEEIIQRREELENNVADSLRSEMLAENFILEEITTDIVFPEGLIKSMEEKNITKQESERARNELVKADAEKQKQIIKAEADAETMKIKADAEAAYNRKIGASLTQQVLEYKKLERWDGKYPISVGQGGIAMLKQI